PNQPQIGCRTTVCRSARTYRNAGAPGPPLRYLYVQPTARSAPAAVSPTGTAPAEWHRSHSTSAPTSCAAAVSAGRSATAPERYDTWYRHSSATSPSSAAVTAAGSMPRSGSVPTIRSLSPRSAAMPASTYRSRYPASRSARSSRTARSRCVSPIPPTVPVHDGAVAVDVLTEIVIGRPCAEVAGYAADPSHAPQWYANIESVRWQTPPPVQ